MTNTDPDWTKDLTWSAQAFHDLVWPHLQNWLTGKLVHVEAITRSDFARDLDTEAGIDAWNVVNGSGVRGVASRVQVCGNGKPFNTFTIRKSRDSGAMTEYEKRKRAIESSEGWIYPVFTVQSYVTSKYNGKLISTAMAKTTDIIELIDRWEDAGCPHNHGRWSDLGMVAQNSYGVWTNRTHNAEFYVISWKPVALIKIQDSSAAVQLDLFGATAEALRI